MTPARCSTVLLAAVAFAGPATADDLTADTVAAALPGLETYAEGLRDRTGVPGLVVAVIHADRVVYLKGFGARELGRPVRSTRTRCSSLRRFPSRSPRR